MSIRERVFDRLFGDLAAERVAAREAELSGVFTSQLAARETQLREELRMASSRDKQMQGFRRITDAERDLSPVTLDRQREIAVHLYTYNPIAKALLDVMREWILGEGVRITAPNERTAAYLDRFWNDRANRWDIRLWQQTLELHLMGERFWPVFTNEFSGLMRFGVIDPSRVKEVITDPDNVEMAIGVVLKSQAGLAERRYRTVLTGDEDLSVLSAPGLKEWERLGVDGELFQFAINRLSTQKRGQSELFVLADWLDGYEQLLFSILQREQALSSYLWDVTLEGASEEEVADFAAKQKYPKPMSMRVHNEKAKWELQGPAFGSSLQNTEHARLFRNHILSTERLPEHWFGGGGDVNKSIGAEMSAPTEKSLTAKQREIRYILEDVVRAQLTRGAEHGEILEAEDAHEFELDFPEPSTRDLTKISAAIQSVAGGLKTFASEGWVDGETSTRVLSSLLQQFGIEADPEEMLDRARTQRQERLADEATRAFDRSLPEFPLAEA